MMITNVMQSPKMIMMVGLPASGKSTFANYYSEKYNANIHSSDAIREELSGDINNQDINDLVFKTLHKRIKDDLNNGKSCIYDACNISYKRRMAFIKELNKITCEKICVLVATPYEECLLRNAARDRKVPEDVINRMYMNFNIPYWYEGWDQIIVTEDYEDIYGYVTQWLYSYNIMNYNQHNHHHKLTLGQHCEQVWKYLKENFFNKGETHDIVMRISGVLHDCAKPKVAAFVDSHGNLSEDCHYYNHQFVSAYDSLFFNTIANRLDVAIRVMLHMEPYFWKEEKTIEKRRKLWGDDLYNDICIIHEADINAH